MSFEVVYMSVWKRLQVLLQSLLLIATLTILGGTLLASTLVTAKAAFHAKVIRAGEGAMNDATVDFVTWAQTNVRDNGIDRLPIWTATPKTIGPVCSGTVSADLHQSPSDGCKLYQTIRWNVTGYSGAQNTQTSSATESVATGLASAQDEQRVSATITVAITDSSQSIQYASRSREVTARVFHSAPFAALVGERDAESESGSISSSEGDTAGYASQYMESPTTLKPNASTPATYTNTRIETTVDCVNTSNNASPNAFVDDNNVLFAPLRAYGNIAWVYETPCKPLQRIDAATAPIGYQQPVNNVYHAQGSNDSSWLKNDENHTSFAW